MQKQQQEVGKQAAVATAFTSYPEKLHSSVPVVKSTGAETHP
jgi:hypothetical protein